MSDVRGGERFGIESACEQDQPGGAAGDESVRFGERLKSEQLAMHDRGDDDGGSFGGLREQLGQRPEAAGHHRGVVAFAWTAEPLRGV